MSDKDKILPSSYLEQIKKDSPYTIVISHRPRKLEDIARYNVNLTLCGHTAGGQYPLTGWIENLSSDMIYGIKKTGTMTVVTTSGVGQYGIPSKIMAPAEIVKDYFVVKGANTWPMDSCKTRSAMLSLGVSSRLISTSL